MALSFASVLVTVESSGTKHILILSGNVCADEEYMDVMHWCCADKRFLSTSMWIALTVFLSLALGPLAPFCIVRKCNATSSPEISLMILWSSLLLYSGVEKISHPRQTVCSAIGNCRIHMP